MPMLAPPTIATLPLSPRSMSARTPHAHLGQEALGVLVKDLFQNFGRITLRVPVLDEALVGEQRIVAAEQDAILETPRNLVLEVGGVIFRRPAVQLVPDIALVHEHRDHLGLPRPARTRGNDLQAGIVSRDPVQVARMTIVENDAVAAGQAGAQPGRADKNQYGDASLDAKIVVGLIGGITGRR